MLAHVNSSAVVGLDAVPIEVEIDIASQGLPSFTIVGLPDKAVEEAKERVRSAIKNSGADFPSKRMTVNLAPADLHKEGPSYDLPIALGILVASEQIRTPIHDALFIGELSLDGRVRHINGILPQVMLAKEKGFLRIFVPIDNAKEASVIDGIDIFPIASVSDLFHHLVGTKPLTPHPVTHVEDHLQSSLHDFDMRDIKGQERAKRALEIAAAGGHNILFKSPPGAGKTLLARTLPSILPRLTLQEALETTKIYSIAGLLGQEAIVTRRQFRSPHHTTSHVGLIGGGAIPKPGEISLTHRGVLFLDELPEFPRYVLESLRQPLEDGVVTVSRAHGSVTFPAKFMLVAAQNPCPCGYFGDPKQRCTCSTSQILKYQKKISGPLLDRIDIHLDVPAVKIDKLDKDTGDTGEESQSIRERVQRARDRQTTRFKDKKISTNAEMSTKDIKSFSTIDPDAITFLQLAAEKMHLSARSYYRVIKIAQTIADLAGSDIIEKVHIAEALQYRPRSEPL